MSLLEIARPHRRDVPRQAVGAAGAADATREKLGLLMGGADARARRGSPRGRACSWCLNAVRERSDGDRDRLAADRDRAHPGHDRVPVRASSARTRLPRSSLFLEPLTDPFSLREIAVKATPLVMIAVGLSLCYIANIWNIGAEGQFLVGAVCGSWLAVRTNGTDVRPLGAAGDADLGRTRRRLYGLIPAICKVRFGASEILTSLMLVYVANLGMDYLVRGPWRDPQGLNFPTTAAFDPSRPLPTAVRGRPIACRLDLRPCRRDAGAVLLGRTIRGFEIRLVGAAPRAARFSAFQRPTGWSSSPSRFPERLPDSPASSRWQDRSATCARVLIGLRLHRHYRRLSRPA